MRVLRLLEQPQSPALLAGPGGVVGCGHVHLTASSVLAPMRSQGANAALMRAVDGVVMTTEEMHHTETVPSDPQRSAPVTVTRTSGVGLPFRAIIAGVVVLVALGLTMAPLLRPDAEAQQAPTAVESPPVPKQDYFDPDFLEQLADSFSPGSFIWVM
jgi:cell division septation protein DedD